MKTYLPQLDGLRFFAFFFVLLHHHPLLATTPLAFVQREGWMGVDLFFALSAFLFARLLSIENRVSGRIDTKRFYLRRILRIWPAYFVYVGFCLWANLFLHGTPTAFPWPRIAGLFTFTDNLFAAFQGYDPISFSGHLWSISYEEQCYILIPPVLWLLSRASSRWRTTALFAAIAAGIAFKLLLILHGPGQPSIYALSPSHFEPILFGGVLGMGTLDRFWHRLPGWFPLPLVVASVALLCVLPSDNDTTLWLFPKYLASGLAAAFMLQAALSCDKLRAFLSHRVLVHLGRRSYGMYLYHPPAILVTDVVARRVLGVHERMGLLSFVLALLVTWIAAHFSYQWLESPFLRIKKRYEVVPSRPI